MLAQNVNPKLFQALNEATHGKLWEINLICCDFLWELDLSVSTFLDGLPDRQMKLYVTAFDRAGKTSFFVQAPLEGTARKLGWNLYLSEKISKAKAHFTKTPVQITLTT